MENKSKLLKGMVLGAFVGGVISMTDEHTRKTSMRAAKKFGRMVLDNVKQPTLVVDKVSQLSKQAMAVSEEVIKVTEKVSQLSNKSPDHTDYHQVTELKVVPEKKSQQ